MPHKTDSGQQLLCSFCGKPQYQVKQLIAGPGVYICDECIALCNEILDEEFAEPPDFDSREPPKPREIYNVLDSYIVGQEHTKRTLSVAVYNHYKRICSDDDDIELQKSNILLLGPTGCGKTLFAQTLARLLDVPFAIADATALTEAGYVGEDVESILLGLIRSAHYDIKRAEIGIIYLDEIDKVARRGASPSDVRDVSGEGVQQALLTMLEGSTAQVLPQGARRGLNEDLVTIDTSNILFICGGSFDGLDKLIAQRIGSQQIGLGAAIHSGRRHDPGELLERCLPEDLIQYGLIPEFISRLPVISAVHQLSREELIRVLTEPRSALVKQVQCLFALDGIELTFADAALSAIAGRALERESGARGLRSIIETLLLDAQFELPSQHEVRRCMITREVVEHGRPPRLGPATPERRAA